MHMIRKDQLVGIVKGDLRAAENHAPIVVPASDMIKSVGLRILNGRAIVLRDLNTC